jgi:hypothetical protein
MADQLLYCRTGWKPSLLSVVGEDKDAGTVDLGNEDGDPIVTGLPFLADPSKVDPLPASYATGAKSSAPKKKSTKKKAAPSTSLKPAPSAPDTDD